MPQAPTRPLLTTLLAALVATSCNAPPAQQPANSPAKTDAGSAAPATANGEADARSTRLAEWNRLAFGMFVHWGLYSELGGVWNGKPVEKGYSEQIQSFANISKDDYAAVARRFKAEKFDADRICATAKDAGARYVMVTSKHHDGFAMFDTKSTDYNIVKATPFGRDAIKLIGDACRKQGLGLGIYFSLVDWHAGHPFDPDNENPIPASMEPLIEQQLTELMSHYGPIVEVWFDMSRPTPEQSRKFAAIVHRLQPKAAINGRIWNNVGDFVTLGDNEAPPVEMQPPFQTPASIYHSTWGYRSWQKRDDAEGKARELVHGLVAVRGAGGNYLLNIGPMGDGSVVPFEADVLHRIGQWLRAHPDAVLDARPSGLPAQWWGPSMVNGDRLYLFPQSWRPGALRIAGLLSDPLEVTTDGASPVPLTWTREGADVIIQLPQQSPDPLQPVVQLRFAPPLRSQPARAFKIPADADLNLAPRSWQKRTSFSFGSGYQSQQTSVVALQTAIESASDAQVWMRTPDVDARQDAHYIVRFGEQEMPVTGKQLDSEAIGPFQLRADTPTAVSIRLAAPEYPAQDLGLQFRGVAFGHSAQVASAPQPDAEDPAHDAHAH